jgi:hypothetical protein
MHACNVHRYISAGTVRNAVPPSTLEAKRRSTIPVAYVSPIYGRQFHQTQQNSLTPTARYANNRLWCGNVQGTMLKMKMFNNGTLGGNGPVTYLTCTISVTSDRKRIIADDENKSRLSQQHFQQYS